MYPFLIFTMAFIVRYIFIKYFPQLLTEGNGARYDVVARNINKGYGMSHSKDSPVLYFGPVYLYFLAFIYKFFGEKDEFRYAQGIIDSITCTILYFVGKEAFSVEIGILTGILAAFYFPFVLSVGLKWTETMRRFSMVIFTLTFILMIKNPSLIKSFICGLALGMDILCVDTMTFFPIFGLVIYFIFSLFCDLKILNSGHLSLFSIGLLIPFGSWVIRNYLVFHRVVFLTLRGSQFFSGKKHITLMKGQTEALVNPTHYEMLMEKYRELREKGKNAIDFNNWLATQGIKDKIHRCICSPLDFMIESWKKLVFFWTSPSVVGLPHNFDSQYKLFLLLGLIGIIWSIIKFPISVTIFLVLLYNSLLFGIFFNPNGRYRLPLMPLFLLFVGAGIICPANTILQYNRALGLIVISLFVFFIIKKYLSFYPKIYPERIAQKISLIPLKRYESRSRSSCYDSRNDCFWHISGDYTIVKVEPFRFLGDLMGCPDYMKFCQTIYNLGNSLEGKRSENITSDGKFLYITNNHNEVHKILIDKLPLQINPYAFKLTGIEINNIFFRLNKKIDVGGMAFDGRNLKIFSKKDKKIYTYSTDGIDLGTTDYSLPLDEVKGLAWDDGFLYVYDEILHVVSKIDVEKGEIMEWYRVPTASGSGIAIKDSMIYFSSSEGRVYQYNMEKAALSLKDIEKVLVFHTSTMDQLKYTLNLLKKIAKTVSVSILTPSHFAKEINELPEIDKIIQYDHSSFFSILKTSFSLVKKIRREKFDLALIPQNYTEDAKILPPLVLSYLFKCKNTLTPNERLELEEDQQLFMDMIKISLPRIRKIAKAKVKRVVIFCASKFAEVFLPFIEKAGLQVVGIADNEPRKQGQVFLGFKVLSPMQIAEKEVDGVIICSHTYKDEIFEQLKALKKRGIEIFKIF